MPAKVLSKLRSWITRLGFEQDWYLIVCGAVIGTLTAVATFGFHDAVKWVEHWSNEGQTRLPIWVLPAIPALGALLTGLLVHYFASAARGHGVPQVMDAVIRQRGVIPLRVGIVKTLASLCTVGSGGSAGVEGPIVQIGSTVGSVFGQRLSVPREHLPTLVGCGAAAGIGAIFNAPIAGVFFVLEIILRDFSLKTFTPIVVSSVFAVATVQTMGNAYHGEGNEAIFQAPAGHLFSVVEMPSYILLGVLCAAISVGFTKLLHVGEELFERLRVHPIMRPVIGAVVLGGFGIAYVAASTRSFGDSFFPPFFGNGYQTIETLINPASFNGQGASIVPGLHMTLAFLGLLCLFKAMGTTATLASGGSGGVFAPSLFMGATAGAAFGVLLETIGVIPHGSPASYALVGMAAVVAGTTFAPLTAILMLFELTREPYVLLPIMIAAIISTASAQIMMRDSIYTAKLRQAGVLIGTGRDLSVLRKISLTSVPLTSLPPEPIYPSDPLAKLITLHAHHHVPDFVVIDQNGTYLGMVTGADIRTALIDREAIPLLLVAELLRDSLPTLSPDETLDTVMDKFSRQDVASLCVVEPQSNRPLGLVTRAEVMKRYQRALEAS